MFPAPSPVCISRSTPCATGAWTCRRPMPAPPSPPGACRKKASCPNEPSRDVRRREFLATGLAFTTTSVFAADSVRFTITGALEQGSLAFGSAPPGSLAALGGRLLDITPDGHFVFAFGYDQTKASLVTVRYPDSGGDSRSFKPKARQYEIQRVNGLPQATVTPPPEDEARIAREAETIYLARLTQSAGTDFLSGFNWPAP